VTIYSPLKGIIANRKDDVKKMKITGLEGRPDEGRGSEK
jgi:hypothetical protein